MLGVPQSTLANWRTRGSIPFKRLEKLAKLTGRSVDWVVTGKESEAAIAELKEIAQSLTKWTDAYAPRDVHAPWSDAVAELYCRFPWKNDAAREAALTCLSYLRSATPEDLNLMRRLTVSLRTGSGKSQLVAVLKAMLDTYQEKHKGGGVTPAAGHTKAAG